MAVEIEQKASDPGAVIGRFTQGKTPQDRVQDVKTQPEIISAVNKLKAQIKAFEEAHPNVKIRNHLKNLSNAPTYAEAQAALAKTFASYLKEYYTAHWKQAGLTDEQITEGLKNLKIKLSDGTIVTRSLLKPDGTVEDNPEVLIGKAVKDKHGNIIRYDADGGAAGFRPTDGKSLTATDGLLTMLTWNNERVRDVRNACFGQLSVEFPRYLRDFPKAPPVQTAPNVPPVVSQESPIYVPRVVELRPSRDSKETGVIIDEKGCPLPEGLAVAARKPEKKEGGLLGAVFGGGKSSIVCPPCPPVLPNIAN
jgi:hypothetical protein